VFDEAGSMPGAAMLGYREDGSEPAHPAIPAVELDGIAIAFQRRDRRAPFVEGDEPLRPLAETYGPEIERHEWFPKRTNAEFARAQRGGAEIELVVWERGCGITLACGTGACATAVAAALTGRAPRGREIAVDLLGGRLGITVAEDLSGVRMRGPARLAFRGECDLEALLRDAPKTRSE